MSRRCCPAASVSWGAPELGCTFSPPGPRYPTALRHRITEWGRASERPSDVARGTADFSSRPAGRAAGDAPEHLQSPCRPRRTPSHMTGVHLIIALMRAAGNSLKPCNR